MVFRSGSEGDSAFTKYDLSKFQHLTKGLDSKAAPYTFSSFIPTLEQEGALRKVAEVVEYPGLRINPLIIMGDREKGRNHLMAAAGRELTLKFIHGRVVVRSSEAFAWELEYSLRERKMDRFGQIYRECQAFLVDEIQVLNGLESAREEFLYIVQSLVHSRVQVILAVDQSEIDVGYLNELIGEKGMIVGC